MERKGEFSGFLFCISDYAHCILKSGYCNKQMLLSYLFVLLLYSIGGSIAIAIYEKQPYFVALKASESLEKFMAHDKTYPPHLQVRNLIASSVEIGDFRGFAGKFSKEIVERLKRCPLVREVAEDTIFQAFDYAIQEDAPRHLARISRRKKMQPYKKYPYIYDSEFMGQGINAYVVDSGVNIDHPEFEGRAKAGKDFTKEGSGDANGHGTHVAGIIGSVTYGVAKNVTIIEVKALNSKGSGSLHTILHSIEFAVQHSLETGKKGVVNLSLGAFKNRQLNEAIKSATKQGLVFVVAAGNSNVNACLTSPGSSEYAITVGAIDDYNDAMASFSNWGECVDVFASGAYVLSVDAKNNGSSSQVLSGTSMASPVVTGMVANLLSEGVEPGDVKAIVLNMAAKNRISRTSMFFKKHTPNKIVYNGIKEKVLMWENLKQEEF